MARKKKRGASSIEKMEMNRTIRWRCVNLKFLSDFFAEAGLNPESYSQYTANPHSTATSLRLQLHKDDMKLSKASEIFANLGYELTVRFEEKEENKMKMRRFEEDGYIVTLPVINVQYKCKYQRLGFLEAFMHEKHLPFRELSKALGLSSGAVASWFHSDDVRISHLMRIKEVYDLKIVFSIVPAKSEQI